LYYLIWYNWRLQLLCYPNPRILYFTRNSGFWSGQRRT